MQRQKRDHETDFAWWVLFTLSKRNMIVSKLHKKYWRTPHNFEIKVSTSANQAYNIGDETGTDF